MAPTCRSEECGQVNSIGVPSLEVATTSRVSSFGGGRASSAG